VSRIGMGWQGMSRVGVRGEVDFGRLLLPRDGRSEEKGCHELSRNDKDVGRGWGGRVLPWHGYNERRKRFVPGRR
jgi:hypothetical protein